MASVFNSTIAAISTPYGCGGIAVIRISGDDALEIADKFIIPKNKKSISALEAGKAYLSDVLYEDGAPLDTGLVTVFRAPHSFTGEDTVEISCHGGILLSREVLMRALECGAVQAGPGEFSRRAFSSGKLTLSTAESISDLIYAKSRAAIRLSQRNASGVLSNKTSELYEDMKSVLSSLYAGIDFPDEDLEPLSREEMKNKLVKIKKSLNKLCDSYKTGRAVIEGVPTAICGKPNTGKSTVLNLLCGSERSIVTNIAGTTRDVVTESVVCGNATLRLSDTAGIHDASDEIEAIGVGRSLNEISGCELVIAVFDGSQKTDVNDEKVISLIKERKKEGVSALALINKNDKEKDNEFLIDKGVFDKVIYISAKTKPEEAHCAISEAIGEIFECGKIDYEGGVVLSNARQYANAKKALEKTASALEAVDGIGEDIAGTELEDAMCALGELDGRQVGIEIVNDIFAKFCVGK